MKVVAVVKNGNPQTGEKGQIGVVDLPKPSIGSEDVLIKVAYCSICGSDPHSLTGLWPLQLPHGLGHEVSGTIEALGPEAKRKGLKIGDRVAGNFVQFCGACYYCRNGQEQFCPKIMEEGLAAARPGMAEYVAWHEGQVFRIPDSVSLEEACLTEPVAIALRAVERADLRIGARIAVSGAGGIGLLIVQLAKLAGASSVTAIEPVEAKRKLAKELGADYVLDPATDDIAAEAMRITNDIGFDAVIESSAASAAASSVLNMLAKGGTGVFFAMYPMDYELPVNLFLHAYMKEVTIRGFNMAPYAFPRAVALLPRLRLKDLIQKVFPMEEAAQAFDAQMSGKYAKVVIKCS
jgi:(R,R)-butanediol dehydrogenase / meso-butanediol dehydrogenase / diacetyl reductase